MANEDGLVFRRAPTDEEMRAEVPAIARPYVMARDKTIAALEQRIEEQAKTIAALRRMCEEYEDVECARRDEDDVMAKAVDGGRLDGVSACEDMAVHAAEIAACTCPCVNCQVHPGEEMCEGACDCKHAPRPIDLGRANDFGAGDKVEFPVADGPIVTRFDGEAKDFSPEDQRLLNPQLWTTWEDGDFARMEALASAHVPRNGLTWIGIVVPQLLQRALRAEDRVQVHLDYRNAERALPRTESDLLHAAQLGARAHVVPYILRAAGHSTDPTTKAVYMVIAQVIDGKHDATIVAGLNAIVRFIEGGTREGRT